MTRARILADYVSGGTTAAEFDYLDGVTSNVQTQMDLKAPITNAALVTPNLGTPSAGVMTNMTGAVEASLVDNAVTLAKMAGGTDGQVITYDASGDPVAVGPGNDGEVLTSTGAGSPPAFEAIPLGGITFASIWHLTTNCTGDCVPITDLAQLGGIIGSAMTISSGIFTFPETGLWSITCDWMFYISADADRSCGVKIETCTNAGSGDTYVESAFGTDGISNTGSGTQFSHAGCQFIFDVTSVTTHKCRISTDVVNTSVISYGSATSARCSVKFVRLGNT